MDVVYVVGPWDDNEELRYSLRSLAAHVPHDRVWLAGHRPPWVTGVGHIPVSPATSRFASSTANLLAACTHPDVSEEFAYFNDDFFALTPVTGIPAMHRGRVADVVAATLHSPYRLGAIATARLLRQRYGVRDPLSYELHLPMPVRKDGMIAAIEAGKDLPVLHKRTAYGNLVRLGGEQVPDCKIKDLHTGIPDGATWVSTTDRSFARGQVGVDIRARFPDPCRYEREGA